MSDERNVFRFDLNESLYFEKGQEVTEMISISLDPEISIQSYKDYVSIRGVIELVGEYYKNLVATNEEEVLYFDDHQKRYIDIIEDATDDRAIFSHRFPVEISVPSYRISDIDDVTVNVETFDYELPHNNQLVVKSKIDIYGIHDESRVIGSIDNKNSNDDDNNENVFDETYELDVITKQDEEHVERESEEQSDKVEPKKESPTVASSKNENDTTAEKDEEKAQGRWKVKSQTLGEFFGNEGNEEELDEEVHDNSEVGTAHGELEDKSLEDEDLEVEDVEGVKEGERQEIDDPAKDVSYLANMFRHNENNEEENQQTQMRLCIVQSDDTLEGIAERYRVTTLQLLKRNDLEDDILTEGQLLYIPSKSTTVDYD